MADNSNKKRLILGTGVALVLVLAVIFMFGGQQGQPSAPSGPGNAMQVDQGL